MKRSGHGDYVSGDVAKTGDKSCIAGGFLNPIVTNFYGLIILH